MPTRRKSHRTALIVKATELALTAPQVIAHRVIRMGLAGPVPSPRDRREFQRMGTEKVAAFIETWNAMVWHVVRAQQAHAMYVWRSFYLPKLDGQALTQIASTLHNTALGVLAKGIAPAHQRTVANARRLGRIKLGC